MFGFGQLIGILKKSPKKIVFTEGEDSRILEASSRLLASNFLHPILIGNEEKIMNAAEDLSPFFLLQKVTVWSALRSGGILKNMKKWMRWLKYFVSSERKRA